MGEIEFDFYAAGQAIRQVEEVANRMSAEVLPGFEETMRGIRDGGSRRQISGTCRQRDVEVGADSAVSGVCRCLCAGCNT